MKSCFTKLLKEAQSFTNICFVVLRVFFAQLSVIISNYDKCQRIIIKFVFFSLCSPSDLKKEHGNKEHGLHGLSG
jgi:hypothetical protein